MAENVFITGQLSGSATLAIPDTDCLDSNLGKLQNNSAQRLLDNL